VTQAAAPPSSVMNSRLFTQSPRRREPSAISIAGASSPKSLRRSRYSPSRSSRVTWRQGPQGSKQHLGSCSSRHAHPNWRL